MVEVVPFTGEGTAEDVEGIPDGASIETPAETVESAEEIRPGFSCEAVMAFFSSDSSVSVLVSTTSFLLSLCISCPGTLPSFMLRESPTLAPSMVSSYSFSTSSGYSSSSSCFFAAHSRNFSASLMIPPGVPRSTIHRGTEPPGSERVIIIHSTGFCSGCGRGAFVSTTIQISYEARIDGMWYLPRGLNDLSSSPGTLPSANVIVLPLFLPVLLSSSCCCSKLGTFGTLITLLIPSLSTSTLRRLIGGLHTAGISLMNSMLSNWPLTYPWRSSHSGWSISGRDIIVNCRGFGSLEDAPEEDRERAGESATVVL